VGGSNRQSTKLYCPGVHYACVLGCTFQDQRPCRVQEVHRPSTRHHREIRRQGVWPGAGRFQIMEGPDKFHRFIVIEFPTFQQGVACFTSPEYDKAAAFRRSGAREVKTIIVQRPDRPTVDDAVVVLENTRGILTRGSRQPWLPCCEPRRSASRLSPFLLLRILGTRLLRLPVFCRCEVCQTLGSLVANCFLILSPPVGQSLPHTK
jgi:Domain of unknown function (DUF1330)